MKGGEKMRGHIKKRGNKYSFIVDIGRDPVTKKRRQKRVSGFTSQKKAREAMTEMITELNKGVYVEPTSDSFEKYINSWLDHKEKRVTYGTYSHYKSYAVNHIIPAIGHIKVQDLRPMHLQDFYDALIGQGQLSKRSIHHIHRIIANCLNMAVKMGEMQTNIATVVEPVRVPKTEQKYWDVDDAEVFIEAARGHIHFIAFYLAIFTGMRQGEILGLKWDSVDFDSKTIYVQRSIKRVDGGGKLDELKSVSSYRSISISNRLIHELKEHRTKQNKHRLMIGKDYDNQGFVVATKTGTFVLSSNISRAFRLIRDKLDIKQIRFHDLRHTHASLLFKQKEHPKVVQERLGHSSIEITMDTYSHMMPNMQEAAAQKLDELFDKKPIKKDGVTNR